MGQLGAAIQCVSGIITVTCALQTTAQIAIIWFVIGIGLLSHHKFATGVWISPEQAFYECHGKIGIMLTYLGGSFLILRLVLC
ncbi:MAG: hypothetical protein ACE5R6_00490 [Candidatus Heimdallarchaeota archaeon]